MRRYETVYVSPGNIPSKWAHTFHVMKMSEAIASIQPEFCMLTQANWANCVLPRFDFETWYGIHHPFRIVQLKAWERPLRVFGKDMPKAFLQNSVAFLARHRPKLVFTRLPSIATECAQLGLDCVLEIHDRANTRFFAPVPELAQHPRVRCVSTITDPLAAEYEKTGIPREKILVSPDGIDLENFGSMPTQAQSRRRLGFKADVKIAVYAGHLYPEKGIDVVMAAAEQCSDIEFVIVGGWPDDVLRFREKATAVHNVKIMGFVPNAKVPDYLAIADALLLPNSAKHPSAEVTSPMKMFEYMAAQRVIVAANLPVFRSVLRNGENAVLFQPDDPTALAHALKKTLASPVEALRMAMQASEDVQQYTWRNRAQNLLDSL